MTTRRVKRSCSITEDVRTDNKSQKSCCCPLQCNPCYWWSSLCSWYVRLLKRVFGWFGERIAKHPLVTISLCLVFVSICSVGFVWFQSEKRTVKLFIPQSSQAINDLNTAEKYFRVKIRQEIVLLTASPDHPNVLAPECLRQAFQVHHAVVGLESYTDFCVTLKGDKAKSLEDCMIITPLEFLLYNETNLDGKNLDEVQNDVNRAYNNSRVLMRNGRPFWYNFNRVFGGSSRKDGRIISAKALQMVYLMSDPSDDDMTEKVLEWENTFIDKLSKLVDTLSCFEVHYSSERSLDDAIAESSGSDIKFVSITFAFMITFACVMLSKFRNPLTGHSLLANAGVFAVALGILAGFGMAMWCRVPFVSIVGVLPFLVLGIGIDDMFIIVDELDRQPRGMSTTDVIRTVMAHSGPTVTMTTVTDLVAFAVSTSTSFPSIRYFCIYAALTVTFSFIMIVTFFVAIMTYDVKRIKSGRRDLLPFCRAPPPKEGAPAWDEPLPQTSNRAMEAWGKFLTQPAAKVAVIVLSLGLLGAGIYGVTQLEETFDRRILAKDDSYLKRFLTAEKEHFEVSIDVSVVETGNIDYGMKSTQEEIRKITRIVKDNPHYRNRSLSWMDAFYQFAEKSNMNITNAAFLPALKSFLSISDFSYFQQDLKFSVDGKKLEASRVLGFLKDDGRSTFQKNAMLTLRNDIASESKLGAFPISRSFIFFEQYAIISRETSRNLLIAALAVFIITSPFLVDCTVTFLVVFNFAALICELFGLMVIWNVTLNAVSMINLVMAIGFAVDYSAHVAHAYVVSNKVTANERMVDALSTIGASVLMGGFSTFLGMIVLAFAASEIFRIFFRMFLGIVGFGLLHGLCIMPVYLSLLCWRPAIVRPSSVRVSTERLDSRDHVGENGEDLHLQHTGKENPIVVGDDTSCQSPGQDNFKNEANDAKISQKGDGTADNVVDLEMGISNEGMEVGEDEMRRISIGEEKIAQQTIRNEADLKPDDKRLGESSSNSEMKTTVNEEDSETNKNTELFAASSATQPRQNENGIDREATQVFDSTADSKTPTHNSTGKDLAAVNPGDDLPADAITTHF